MLAEILHALIDAAGDRITDNDRGRLHGLADDAETEFQRRLAAAVADLAPGPADAGTV